jgi:imidazolonepropionase-like amidohydrolase
VDRERVIWAGGLIDGTGGLIKKDVRIRIRHGEIVSLERVKEHTMKEAVMDCSRHTVLPWMVDSHVHLFKSGTPEQERGDAQRCASSEMAKETITKNLSSHVRYGVWAVRDGGDHEGYVLRFSREKRRFKDELPLVKAAGFGWRAYGRYGRLIAR